jgi:DNA-binding response OmpR family regulator
MAGRLDGLTIVVVDDDVDIAEAIDEALCAEGATTHVVHDGNAGVAAVAEHRPELVVLDMMLPGRSGFLVLEKIKGEAGSPSVVMLTANEGKRHQAYATGLGVDRYLLKPAPMDKLIDTLREMADARVSDNTPPKPRRQAP